MRYLRNLKEDHKTIMNLENVEFDNGLKDKLFTKRYLKRAK
ncbi:MAG: outer membrane lipoprotein-sorting protein [Caldisericaceae bacterium]|nr:outer membrane lipoprotein-sorting protein [Caldisericaceae bacterium]